MKNRPWRNVRGIVDSLTAVVLASCKIRAES